MRLTEARLWSERLLLRLLLGLSLPSWSVLYSATLLVTVLIASVGEALPEIIHSIPKESDSRLYGVEARSPERGLFLGRVGSESSFGFVSMAQ